MPAIIENVVVHEAVPAQPAVIKKVMVLTVDQETKDAVDSDLMTIVSIVIYSVSLFSLYWVFYHFDVLNELNQPCTYYYHGGCDDGGGLATFLLPLFINFVLMIPALISAANHSEASGLLLKQLGWDGKSEYRLEVEQKSG